MVRPSPGGGENEVSDEFSANFVFTLCSIAYKLVSNLLTADAPACWRIHSGHYHLRRNTLPVTGSQYGYLSSILNCVLIIMHAFKSVKKERESSLDTSVHNI